MTFCLVIGALGVDAGEHSATLLERSGRLAISIDTAEPVRAELPEGVRLDRTVAVGDGFVAVGTERSRRLVVLESDGVRTWSLPSPGTRGPQVAEPVPLAVDGRLIGVAWLDGSGRGAYAVRYAAWDRDRWRATETVSRSGSGSQIALAAAAGADGSVLLAWSAFDGHDDEIVWSHRLPGVDSRWSEPTPAAANNEVPDITPALAAFDTSFTLAWSRFDDGQYRLVIARFNSDGDGFEPATPAAAPGSLFPEFHPGHPDAAAVLSFRDAAIGAWAVIRVDESGRSTGRITLRGRPDERPKVVWGDGESILVFEAGADRPTRLSWEPEL